jgi:DnaJ-domain-containing protein 1
MRVVETVSNQRSTLGRGELVRYLYRLGRRAASGVLTITVAAAKHAAPTDPMARGSGSARAEIFVLRRGAVVLADGDLARRASIARIARLVALDRVHVMFEDNVTAYPPGSPHQLPLVTWARTHLEQQLDGTLADVLVRELAGIRLSVRVELAPDPATCDEADRRMLAALAQPRRLDQIWPLARTPRFRLLAFIHFLRAVDALDVVGVVADRSAKVRAIDPRREAARRLLGLSDDADLEAIKRAYRKLARELHPDLQPSIDLDGRRLLERRFAEVTAAYEALI